uniref:Uncharacterized protein n=1 Tax=Chromera velia CCMP2878 TaxID=1169474 RepID=A0A0G4IFN1_9ALVE|eukprot:Cvel_14017.t1-p1 / transcript=Cvel_14017.t1 / gene=Cvel_14017 / organism=Chromera_velia_CCMP2878 / gene_product=hypothetical protein / transcript_product=hypothetical protein / location=Cvel_scaffold981:34137-36880(-) / protein_length=688 / sequence_SO=supercontig / SO=protein_coding / is_pseudo=false
MVSAVSSSLCAPYRPPAAENCSNLESHSCIGKGAVLLPAPRRGPPDKESFVELKDIKQQTGDSLGGPLRESPTVFTKSGRQTRLGPPSRTGASTSATRRQQLEVALSRATQRGELVETPPSPPSEQKEQNETDAGQRPMTAHEPTAKTNPKEGLASSSRRAEVPGLHADEDRGAKATKQWQAQGREEPLHEEEETDEAVTATKGERMNLKFSSAVSVSSLASPASLGSLPKSLAPSETLQWDAKIFESPSAYAQLERFFREVQSLHSVAEDVRREQRKQKAEKQKEERQARRRRRRKAAQTIPEGSEVSCLTPAPSDTLSGRSCASASAHTLNQNQKSAPPCAPPPRRARPLTPGETRGDPRNRARVRVQQMRQLYLNGRRREEEEQEEGGENKEDGEEGSRCEERLEDSTSSHQRRRNKAVEGKKEFRTPQGNRQGDISRAVTQTGTGKDTVSPTPTVGASSSQQSPGPVPIHSEGQTPKWDCAAAVREPESRVPPCSNLMLPAGAAYEGSALMPSPRFVAPVGLSGAAAFFVDFGEGEGNFLPEGEKSVNGNGPSRPSGDEENGDSRGVKTERERGAEPGYLGGKERNRSTGREPPSERSLSPLYSPSGTPNNARYKEMEVTGQRRSSLLPSIPRPSKEQQMAPQDTCTQGGGGGKAAMSSSVGEAGLIEWSRGLLCAEVEDLQLF